MRQGARCELLRDILGHANIDVTQNIFAGTGGVSEWMRGMVGGRGWLFLAVVMDLFSRKGNCWDNAVTETLFGSLKVERLHGERFQTIRQAKDAVLAWLLWYNRQRMHSTLNYLSPTEFESRWENAGSQAA
jgi:transposase InsO family protein